MTSHAHHPVFILFCVIVLGNCLPIAPPMTHFDPRQEYPHHHHHDHYHHEEIRHQEPEPMHEHFQGPTMEEMCAYQEFHSSQNPRHHLCHPAVPEPMNPPHPLQFQDSGRHANLIHKHHVPDRVRRQVPERVHQRTHESNHDHHQHYEPPREQRYPRYVRPDDRSNTFNRHPFQPQQDMMAHPPQDQGYQSLCTGPDCHQRQPPQHLHIDIVSSPAMAYPQQMNAPSNQKIHPQSNQPPQRYVDPHHRSANNPNNNNNNNQLLMKPESVPKKQPQIRGWGANSQPAAVNELPLKPSKNSNSKAEELKLCSSQLPSSTAGYNLHHQRSSSSTPKCLIVIYDVSDAAITYETKLESYE